MNTRLNVLASRHPARLARRHGWRSNTLQRGRDFLEYGTPSWTRSDSSSCPRRQRPRVSFSSFHTTIPSIASSASVATAYEGNDHSNDEEEKRRVQLSEDIERFSEACLAQLLPDEMFYNNAKFAACGNSGMRKINSYSNHKTLESELGIDSIWETETGLDDEFDDHCVDEMDELYHARDSATKSLNHTIPTEDHSRPALSYPVQGRESGGKDVKKSAMEILRDFDPQNPPDSDDKEEMQLWLECFAQRDAVLKHQQLVERARDRKAFDSMSMMQRHIVQWFHSLRDAIELRQKEYLLNQQEIRIAHKRYGPFICSLHPEKLAVISSQEAVSQALLQGGKNGHDGVPLVKIAFAIGTAVEMEVVTQRRIKERFHGLVTSSAEATGSDDGSDDVVGGKDSDVDRNGSGTEAKPSQREIDRWKFSPSHLKLFLEDIEKIGMGKGRRAINYAVRRAKQTMNDDETWTEDDITHLGAALLSILVDHAKVYNNGKEEPAFRVEKIWSHRGKKCISHIVLHDRLQKAFLEDDYLSWAANTTRHMPMIVPPSKWVGPKEGGYRWLEVDLMRTHGSSVQKEVLEKADLSFVFDGLNVLGKTSWIINKEILAVGEYCWENNIPIGDIPSRTDFEVPPEPVRPPRLSSAVYSDKEHPDFLAAMSANRLFRDSMSKRQRVHQRNMDLRSLRCSAMLKLNQAQKFKDSEKIYFPYNLDFRGRAYPVPPHLSNVGSDLCRGMLKFSDAKPLGKRGLYWLKVHLANFAGKDKMSFDDRAKYIDDNLQSVRDSVDNPFSESPWWKTLDDPFQGLATCHEIVRAIDSGNPEAYMCSLPVHMDGSCNGLQHYAALGRDPVGGKAVNLLEGEGPEDVYVGVMHEVIRRVAEEAATDVGFDTSNFEGLSRSHKKLLKNIQAAKLVNGLIDRGVVKRTVMTSVYGVTYVGARQQIQEKIEEKLKEKGFDIDELDREIFAAAGYLATVTMEVMGDLFQGAKRTKTWLADCARIISQQGHPVAWISPIGLPAIQPYRQRRSRTIVTVMQSVTIVTENDDLQVHKSRQVTAFPPNYVHSLDSSHMLMTAIEMDRRGLTFSAVHDSFWTHACDVDEMNEALRDCFVELYSKPLLSDLKASWELRYPEVEFPELPELGDLDLNEVKSATYFFQ